MMEIKTTSPDHYAWACDRYESWVNLGCPQGDPAMVPLMQKCWLIPGIVPMFCCEGHPTDTNTTDWAYVCFCVNRKGAANFVLLVEDFFDTMPDLIYDTNVYIANNLLSYKNPLNAEDTFLYQTVALHVKVTVESKPLFLESLTKAIHYLMAKR